MVGNVQVIRRRPSALVKAIEENREPDPVLPAKGLLRSRHNNYFTLPVLFIMISNHFLSGLRQPVQLADPGRHRGRKVLVRHYSTTRHEQPFRLGPARRRWGMIALAFVTTPNYQQVFPCCWPAPGGGTGTTGDRRRRTSRARRDPGLMPGPRAEPTSTRSIT